MPCARSLPGVTVERYTGLESVEATLRLFARASAVVGIQGAGLANVVFAPQRVCVVEVSTFLGREMKARWRSNHKVRPRVRRVTCAAWPCNACMCICMRSAGARAGACACVRRTQSWPAASMTRDASLRTGRRLVAAHPLGRAPRAARRVHRRRARAQPLLGALDGPRTRPGADEPAVGQLAALANLASLGDGGDLPW
eukprot:7389289-Prymnesium_polylepis.1